MAYGVMPYLVAWDTLRSLYGARDMELYQRVLDKQSRKIAELKHHFDDEPAAYVLDILNGVNQHKSGALYGYAFEMICDTTGSTMNNSEWYPTSWWGDIESALTDELPFSLPYSEDFPVYYVISPESTERVANSIKKIGVISDPAKAQFLHWLKRGEETNRALVLFYY